jgi:hypothetical protein
MSKRAAPSSEAPARTPAAVLLSLAFLLVALLAFRQVGSVDAGFHLRAGNAILSGAGWPTHDTFTYTVNDHEYVDTSWGFQVLAALVERAAGAPGLVLLVTAAVLGTFLVLYRTARLVPSDPLWLAAWVALGGLASELRFEARPEILSYLFLAVVLHLLHRHAEGRAAPLWALPAIHLVWVNTHGLFVLGWIAMACFVLGLAWKSRALDRRLLLWSAASVPATLVNPYGLDGTLFPLTLATRLQGSNVFAQAIGEFASPFALRLSDRFPFYPRVSIFSFRILLVVSLVGAVVAFRRKRPWCTLLWVAFVPLAYKMIRNLPVFVLATLPATVWALPAGSWLGRKRWRRLVEVAIGAAVVVLGLRVATDAYYVDSRREDRTGWGWNRHALAVETGAYLRNAPDLGRMLNHLNLGGYLIWATPRPVFIDGRLEVVGEEFFSYYAKALESQDALEA